MGTATRLGARRGATKLVGLRLVTMAAALAVPAAALSAEGAKVLNCIQAVSKASWASFENREALAAIACQGAGDFDASSKEFQKRVAVIGDCFRKVTFRSRVRGPEAELIAANANPAEETAACVKTVSFRLGASGILADTLAAIACGR